MNSKAEIYGLWLFCLFSLFKTKLASMAQSLSSSMLSGDKDSDVEILALAGSIVTLISNILDSASEASALPSTD